MASKYQKEAQKATNEILIESIEWGIARNNNAKVAIYASITKPFWRVDESYIKEKLQAVRSVDRWLPCYLYEAEQRNKSGELSMQLMKRYNDAKDSTKRLFEQ